MVVREPGTKYEYSPAGYTIIQQVLVSIYKNPFADIMQSLILKPLDMEQSTFAVPLPQKYKNKIATPYLPDGKPVPNGPYMFPAVAAGGLWTSPSQLAHFLIAFEEAEDGKSTGKLSATLVHKMTKPTINHNMGLGIDINLNRYGDEETGKGNYFGFSGFNTGYLSLMVGSKNGNGVIIMVNTAPYMTVKDVTQFKFLKLLERHIAILMTGQVSKLNCGIIVFLISSFYKL